MLKRSESLLLAADLDLELRDLINEVTILLLVGLNDRVLFLDLGIELLRLQDLFAKLRWLSESLKIKVEFFRLDGAMLFAARLSFCV